MRFTRRMLCLLLGLILLCNPVGFTTFVHFLIGIVVLTDSMFKLQTAFDAKRFGISNWWVIGLTSLLTGVSRYRSLEKYPMILMMPHTVSRPPAAMHRSFTEVPGRKIKSSPAAHQSMEVAM